MNNEYLSISDINKIIKYTIEGNEELRSVYLKGEISNIKYHSRGHLYFSLKDGNALLYFTRAILLFSSACSTRYGDLSQRRKARPKRATERTGLR